MARGSGLAAVLAVALAAAPGCASPPWVTAAREEAAPASRLSWPPPPDPPRIELVSVFDRPSHLGIRRSIWRRLADLVSGAEEPRMLRPAGIAVSGEHIAVADAGSGVVHLFDRAGGRYRGLDACGDTVLRQPVGVAFLAEHLYVSDAPANQIHVFDPDGDCAGHWALEQGSRPADLAADPATRRLYVADPGRHRVVVFAADGKLAATIGSRGEGPGELNFPGWLTLDATGRLWVTDTMNFRIQVFEPDGRYLRSFGRKGDAPSDFARPKGIGVGRGENVYVADALFDAVQIFDREGRYLMAFGSRGIAPGQFWLPADLAIDGDHVYVSDSYNRRVQIFRYLGDKPS